MKESIRSDILQKVVWKPPLYQSEEIDPLQAYQQELAEMITQWDKSYIT